MPKLFCMNRNLKLPLYSKLVRLFKENCVSWKTKTEKKKRCLERMSLRHFRIIIYQVIQDEARGDCWP